MEKPISTLCHCWGVRPWQEAEVTEQCTKEEGQQESDAPPLAQISEAELVVATVIYLQGGLRLEAESGGGGVRGERGQIRDWWSPSQRPVLAKAWRTTVQKSTVRLSLLFPYAFFLIIILLSNWDHIPLSGLFGWGLKGSASKDSRITLYPRNVGRGSSDHITPPNYYTVVFTAILNIHWNLRT